MLAYALTTVARQKTFLGISSTTYDTVLDRMIDSATDFIEKHCDRRFKKTAYTSEIHNGHRGQTLLLRQYPVIDGQTFTFSVRDSYDNSNNWSAIDATDYFVENVAGIVHYIGGSFEEVPQHYKFAYTAGYDFNNTSTFLSDAGAADLEYLCWKLVGKLYNDRKESTNIQSESLGDYSVSFARDMMLDKELKEIADKYRRPPRH